MLPSPWVSLVLVLGTYRVVRLVGWDDLPPVVRLRAWVTGEVVYRTPTEGRDRDLYRYDRPVLNHFLGCAYCSGAWVSLAVYLAWLWKPTPTVYALAVPALAAAVGLVAKNLDP